MIELLNDHDRKFGWASALHELGHIVPVHLVGDSFGNRPRQAEAS
jgi:hypothetical protein